MLAHCAPTFARRHPSPTSLPLPQASPSNSRGNCLPLAPDQDRAAENGNRRGSYPKESNRERGASRAPFGPSVSLVFLPLSLPMALLLFLNLLLFLFLYLYLYLYLVALQ